MMKLNLESVFQVLGGTKQKVYSTVSNDAGLQFITSSLRTKALGGIYTEQT